LKKVLSLILALVMVLVCVSFTGCLKKGLTVGDNTINIPDSEGGGGITVQGSTGGGETPENFGDIPIYPGCKQLAKITGEEDMNGQPGILDHRIYSTSDSVDKVVSFYKTQMPANGWTEESWYESTMNVGTYNKGEQSYAVIAVTPADTEGESMFTIDKKYQK
jgi:hypothetical protein